MNLAPSTYHYQPRGRSLEAVAAETRLVARIHRGARISGRDALALPPVRAHAMRMASGRPSSSIRFRTWTPMAASVA
jgi:hypothetical protein